MAKVKILLEPGETELDADQALQKAIDFHSSGDAHVEENFNDPAMRHLMQQLEEMHERTYAEIIKDVSHLLDQEFADGN